MKKRTSYFLMASLVTLTVSLTSCNLNSMDKLREEKLSEDKGDMIEFNLYYNASNEETNSAVKEEKRSINKDEVIGRIIIEELIKGPSANGNLQGPLPKDTRLLSFTIKDNIGYVSLDLGAEDVKMTPSKEVAALKCMLISLSQITSINQVKISIPKTNQETFAGNIDITKPININDFLKDHGSN
ncbi:MAG: GerMN domain-containing protein [Clostridiaceae bacterium]